MVIIMILSNGNATIIVEKVNYVPDYTNQKYVFDFKGYKNDALYSILRVQITIDNSSENLFIFCDFCSAFECCTVLNDEKLYTIKFNTLYEIDIITKQIRYIDLDDLSGAMGLYKTDDGLIVHGEMEIVKLDFELNEIWHFLGADIFASLLDKPAIQIYDDRIELLDFQNNHYVISHSGKLIKQDKH